MAKRIDWYYHRKGWTSCKRADAYFEGRDVAVRETVNAAKEKYGEGDLEELFDGASKVLVAKGKKTLSFDPRKDDLDEIAEVVIGRSGNLRAPSIRMGKTWLVGFNEEVYGEKFGW